MQNQDNLNFKSLKMNLIDHVENNYDIFLQSILKK